MDLNLFEQAWDKQAVAASTVPVAAMIARLEAEVHSAQRRFRGALVIAVSLLVLGWGTMLAAHFTGIKTLTPLTLLSQIIGSALYIALLVRARRSARGARREIALMSGTLRESIAATLRTLELQIQNTRIAVVAIPLAVAIYGGFFLAKYFTGEMSGFGAAFGGAFLSVFGIMLGGAIWHRYRTVLVPRRRELNETLNMLS